MMATTTAPLTSALCMSVVPSCLAKIMVTLTPSEVPPPSSAERIWQASNMLEQESSARQRKWRAVQSDQQ